MNEAGLPDADLWSMSEAILLATLMKETADCVYFKDRESRFVKISLPLSRRFGLGSPGDAVGKTDFDFFSNEHAEEAFADEQHIMGTGASIVNKVEKETWPDGRITWASTSKVPLFLPSGKMIGLVGISRDITKEKQATELLERREHELNVRMDVMRRDHESAKVVQSSLIPGKIPETTFAEVAVCHHPMDDIGGDVVTFSPVTENHLGFFLADVSGHGVSAGLYTLLVKHLADKYLVDNFCFPEAVLTKMDEDLRRLFSSGFVTAAAGFLKSTDNGHVKLFLSHAASLLSWFNELEGGKLRFKACLLPALWLLESGPGIRTVNSC